MNTKQRSAALPATSGKMKMALLTILMGCMAATAIAQTSTTKSTHGTYENYGRTLNLGLGIGYFGYVDHSVPFFSANYEFDVARQFTLAPFIGFASYRSDNYWENGNRAGRYYYHETFVPVGVKGTYYFDKLLGAGPAWDFYGALSLGFAIHSYRWDDGYTGNRDVYRNSSPVYLDLHIGTEYHINKRAGIFIDLSTGVSTIGVAIHGN